MDKAPQEDPTPSKPIPRRRLVRAATIGWAALGGSAVLGYLAGQRFLMPNVLDEPDPRLTIGPLAQYARMAPGSVSEAFRTQGVWIVRLERRVVALGAKCTHLGCLTHWASADNRFKCPCHGSQFSLDGTELDGPAPRALDRLAVRLKDRAVEVDRSRRFVKERGEWDAPDSFIAV